MSMISLLLHESEAKRRMSVNNKDIMYLGYNLFISQNTAPINTSNNGFWLCLPIKASFVQQCVNLSFFLGDIYLSS